jgi:ribosomal protein S28E/S33
MQSPNSCRDSRKKLVAWLNGETGFANHDLGVTHGAWVQVLAVTGTVGALTFVAIWVQMFRDAGRILSRTRNRERVIVLSGICLVITQLVAWVLDMSFVSGFRWGLIGLAYVGIMSGEKYYE